MIRYGVAYINGEKIILSTNGFCNKKRILAHQNMNNDKTWGIRVGKQTIKLSRLMAHLFIDETFDIVEQKGKRDRVVVFNNNDYLDLRIDNIRIVSQKENVNRNRKVEDEVLLINLKGKVIKQGRLADISSEYEINKGCLCDTLKGNNTYCTANTGEKCIVIKVKDYNKDIVNKKIEIAKKPKHRSVQVDPETELVQIDVDGNVKIVPIKFANKICNPSGLRMCLNGKRLSSGGYIWLNYEEYLENPNLVQERLDKVKSSKFYGSKIKLKKF